MTEKMTLDEKLQLTPNLILGMNNCSDCTVALKILAESGIFFGYCPRETHQEIVEEVKTKYNHSTFPAIFINKKFIGDEHKLQEHFKNNK